MRAGTLNQRISIRRTSMASPATQNSFGEDVPVVRTYGPYWASVMALQGRELEAAQQRWADARFKIRMRYQPDITFETTDTITWGARTLNILDVQDPDSSQRELILTCSEVK